MNKIIAILLSLIPLPVFAQNGYYVMQPLNGNRPPLLDKVVASPKLAGLHVRDKWQLVEPRWGVYDFGYLDQQIIRANRFGKSVTIGIYASVANDPPYNDIGTFTAMVQALGKRYDSSPAISAVHISAPQVTNESMEMYLPSSWRKGDATAIAIWQRSIDAFNAAFPTKPLIIDIAMAPNSRGAITKTVDNYAVSVVGSRLIAIVCNLKADTNVNAPHMLELQRMRSMGVKIGFEMVGPSSDRTRFGGTFIQAIRIGNSFGSGFYQIYQGDIDQIK